MAWDTFGIGNTYVKMLLQKCHFSIREPVINLEIIELSELLLIYPSNIVIIKKIWLNAL